MLVGLLYKTYRINESDKGGLVPLWIQTFLLGVTCLTSLFYMIYTIYNKINSYRNQNKVEIEDNVVSNSPGKKTLKQVELDHNMTI